MSEFVGRARELAKLRELRKKRSASFVVIRGRRRIGKSRLIREFGKDIPCHIFSGLPVTAETTKQSQLDEFCGQLERAFQTPKLHTEDWGAAFWHLGQLCKRGQVMIALDEISWIGSKDPDFLGQLKNVWDLMLSMNSKLILIVCGSVSSWISKNILSSTGFVGRISLDMRLEELPLSDAMRFWQGVSGRVAPQELLAVLAVTGGVPRYLEDVKPELSADENIRRLCFSRDGLLFREFNQIFSDLFSTKASTYRHILQFLSGPSRTSQEIAGELDRSSTRVSEYLRDLTQAGFTTEDANWSLRTGKRSQLKSFRLSDNYSRFYLRYVAPRAEDIAQGTYEERTLHDLPGWTAMMGLQFENLVINNIRPLWEAAGLQFSDVERFGPYFQRQTTRQRGCQVDLLVQTRFRTVYVCEIKFLADRVGLDVVREIEEKVARFSVPRGWSVRTVLVHVNGVTAEVRQSQAFDHIVDFSDLLTN